MLGFYMHVLVSRELRAAVEWGTVQLLGWLAHFKADDCGGLTPSATMEGMELEH